MSKTMKPPPRRVATPAASNKRKEREVFYAPEIPKVPKFSAAPRAGSSSKPCEPVAHHQNQLLAGYMAHEFLTKGTLLGEKWPAAAGQEAPAPLTETGEWKRKKGKERAERSAEAYKRYVEVADLLKRGGAHLPGVVNPTLLGRYLQM